MTSPPKEKAPVETNETSPSVIKFMEFVKEPMDGKPVDTLPGINRVLGSRLRRQGYGRVSLPGSLQMR